MKKMNFIWLLMTAAVCSAQNLDAPLMGWSSWNTFALNISEQIIKGQADAMANSGLKEAGYLYINIDDGYFYGRDERGVLQVNPQTFPNGMRPLVDYIHSLGLKAGIYNDAGHSTCGCQGTKDPLCMNVGLYGHDRQDVNLFFNEYDFDFIKVDFCGGSGHNLTNFRLSERERYTDISNTIKQIAHKNVRLNVCRWAYPGTWVSEVAGSWRTTGDIRLKWESVKDIIAENLYLAAYSSAGHFNDMDMLEVGRGLSKEEDRTHFGMWCIMNSPLLIGCDMTQISQESFDLFTNAELIAVNQDKTFQQAYVVKKVKECFILVRDVEELFGNTRVVAIYNPSDESQEITFALSDIDLEGENTTFRDLFDHVDATADVFSSKEQTLRVNVPAHATRIYKVNAEKRLERRRYEAETAYNPMYQELINNEAFGTGRYDYHEACSGGIKATWLGNDESNALRFRSVKSFSGGKYQLTIGYLSGEERAFEVIVNDKEVERIVVEPNSWDSVSTVTVDVNLNKGDNVIQLANAGGWMPDIDYIELIPAQ